MGTTVRAWSWDDDLDIERLVLTDWWPGEPRGVVSRGDDHLVVTGELDDWRTVDGSLGAGGVLLRDGVPTLVAWDASGVRVLPPGCPPLPWLVVEPEGELAEVLAALVGAVPQQWCQDETEDVAELEGAVTLPEDAEWLGALMPIPVPEGAPPEYLLMTGRRGGSVVMRECAGIVDDWWQDAADLCAGDCVNEGSVLLGGWSGMNLGRTHPGHPDLVSEDVAGAEILCAEVAGVPVAETVNGVVRRLAAPSAPSCALLTAISSAEGRRVLIPGGTVVVTDAEVLSEWDSTARPHRSLHHLSEGGQHVVIVDHGPLLPAPRVIDGAREYHSATVLTRRDGRTAMTTLWWSPGDDLPVQVGEDSLAGRMVEGWYHPVSTVEVDPLLLGLWRDLVG